MESKKFNIKIKNYLEEYKTFKQILSGQITFIKDKYKDIDLSNINLNDKENDLIFIYFSHIKHNIICNFTDNNTNENELYYNIIMNFGENSTKNQKFNLFYYWYHFIIISLTKEIKIFLTEKKEININYNTININKLLYLFKISNDIINILYKNNKLNIKEIISLLNTYIIWLDEKNSTEIKDKISYDKYFKLKNYYLFKMCFNLLKNIFLLELKNHKEKELKELFHYLNKINSFIDINNRFNNYVIIINNESFQDFLKTILRNMNLNIYEKYKNNLLNFYQNFLKNNFNRPKITENIINNIKNSFLNLSEINTDINKNIKTTLENDLLAQNFYCKLLYSLFDDYASNLDYIKFFNYNGVDSKISFKLSQCSLINTILIFSFSLKIENINLTNHNIIYPLLTIYDDSKNKNIFKIYIKKKSHKNKFILYKEQEKNKDQLLNDFLDNDKTYYIALYFEEKNFTIYLNKLKNTHNIKTTKNKENIIQIGYDNISQEYFKGFLGPIILLKNNEISKKPEISKKIAKIIYKILNLKEKYPYIIYSLCKDSIYKFDYMDNFKYYYNFDKEQLDIQNFNMFNNINELKDKFDCLIYLTPSIFEYHSDMKESSFDKYGLPSVPNICENQKNYNFVELNISLIKYENIPIDFLMNNGLYFICLQYEYIYQLTINLIQNNQNENYNNFLMKNEIKETINSILNNTIKILIKYCNYILNFYAVFKMIFLNLFNCIKYLNKYNKNIIFDSVILNLGNLIYGIIDDINNKSDNNSNNISDNDIKKLIIFRDGLIDFLLSSELYDNVNLEIIKYIFSLLFSINKIVKNNIFITNNNLLWKILSFIQLSENLFNDKNCIKDNNKNNKNINNGNKNNQIDINIQYEIFNMLKEYFLSIKSEEKSKKLFCDLLHFCISNNKDKYVLLYYYLDLIYELISNEYSFNEKEIQILIDYCSELIKNNNNNNVNEENNIVNDNNIIIDDKDDKDEIIQKIISIICRILINLIFLNLSSKELNNKMIDLINSIEFTNENLGIICKEIDNLFHILFNKNQDDGKNISKIYSRIFKFILAILNKLIKNKKNVEYDAIIQTKLTNELLSLLISINKKINEEFLNEKKNDNSYLSLLNYIKFLYKIVLNEDIFNNFTALEIDMFIFNLTDIVHICSAQLLIYTNILIKIKTNKKYYYKTIIEIIIDIYINILFNDKFVKSHKLIYMSLNTIFENIPIGNKNYTSFYYNDYLINLFNKKKLSNEDKIIKDNISIINEILLKKYTEKYEMSFTTFFILKFGAYFENLHNFVKNDNALYNYLDNIIQKLLDEHQDLYKLNENIFSKNSNNFYYNHLKEKIRNIAISKNKDNKNNDLMELKEFCDQKLSKFEKSIAEEITSGNCNIKKNIDKRNKSQILINIDNNINMPPHSKSIYKKRKLTETTDFTYKSSKNLNYNPSFTYIEKNNFLIVNNDDYSFSNNTTNLSKKYNTGSNIEVENAMNENENDNEKDIDKEENKEKKIDNNNNDINIDNNLNINEFNNIKEPIIKENIIEKKENEINENINIDQNIIINIDDNYIDNKKSEINEINISEHINSIYFFEDIDKNYVINYKKYLMNNIFSIFFMDTFFYNDLFKKMKIYYLNKYQNVNYGTKMLNYPSKMKNYNNGLEPGIFLKQHPHFFNSKYFPISHPYFVEYLKNNNIYNKSIKLIPKELPNYLLLNNNNNGIKFKLNCELIKIDYAYFGHIIGFNMENKEKYIIFQEKEFYFEENENIFAKESYYKYLFSLTYLTYIDKKNKKIIKNKTKKRKNKVVIIFFSEIEEIIERRFLLMWQGFEIYLKNGKSYFFNMFSEKINNQILEYFKQDEKIKNLVHSKDFLFKEKEISNQWKNYHLLTYEYLLIVNKYGSRTLNDNGQYPVFPWLLLKDYEKIEEINEIKDDNVIENYFNNKGENIDKKTKDLFKAIRKLKYPICIQNEEKKKQLIEKYNEEDDPFKYHLGIHYSTSSYIYYYLMREEPYSDLLIKLQNYQQENPNRMFIGIFESINLLEKSKDPREIIPDLFQRFEFLINLNCDYFGLRTNDTIVDDNIIKSSNKISINPFYNFVNFIIEHRKLLNSKIISLTISDWIDNIFGINQIPQNNKLREISCNVFMKTSYEQEMNLQKKLNKYINKIKTDEQDNHQKYLKKMLSKINSVLNFGQTPYQVFKEKHYKRKLNELFDLKNENDDNEEKENNEDDDDDDNLLSDGFEKVYNILKTQSINYEMRGKKNYIYFDIYPTLDKIFVLSLERNIEIINTKLYNIKGANQYSLSYHDTMQLPYFLFREKRDIEFEYTYFIYKIKYAFSVFDDINENLNYKDINTNELFHTYGREIVENIINNKQIKKKIEKKNTNKKKGKIENENIYHKFITCRYIDKSFKIHKFPKDKNNKNKDIYKPISFICEDFVCSCCAISFCQFLIGLKNGKLIQFYIEEKEKEKEKDKEKGKEKEKEKEKNKNNNEIEVFQIKMEKYIQAHMGKINVIEINKKLGIIITCGDDNYILIRKLYDFELLSPIKIKNKFIISMAKISPLNFIYIICFNKIKNLSVIFGYTLTGLKFAKSEYGFYDNIDFTMNGNIITLKNHNELCILSGSELKNIKMNENDTMYEDFIKKKNKVKDSIWLRFDYFKRENDEDSNNSKIITYYKIENNKKHLSTIDVSQNKYFD